MIKVESNMLILDSSFSKDDASAINHFINIAKAEERERIIRLLDDNWIEPMDWLSVKALIEGEQK